MVWNSLGKRLQDHQDSVIQVLQEKLQSATKKLDSLVGVGGKSKVSIWSKIFSKIKMLYRLKYALYEKDSLAMVVDDLERWERLFDPSWYFLARITRLAVPMIDQELTGKGAAENKPSSTIMQLRHAHEANEKNASASSIFLPASDEIWDRKSIAFSFASTGRHSNQRVIIDHISIREQSDLNVAANDVRNLARVLSKVDPAIFGLLLCQGVIKVLEPSTENITGFDLIFAIPPELNQGDPRSLRCLLSDQETKYHLNERLHLAVSLARSIVFLHSSRLVHKNISPENIIVGQSSSEKLGTPFLVGFERFRFADGRTYMAGDRSWEKNLYRHPKRQGLYPEEEYTMHHDIYSVGVCLLEIGLWSCFVDYSEDREAVRPGSDLPISDLIEAQDQRKAAANVKAILVDTARSRLPLKMGNKYTDIVVSCLTCLDKDNEAFGDDKEFEDEDGIIVGVRYIEKVIRFRS
jgi:hypothetical protein